MFLERLLISLGSVSVFFATDYFVSSTFGLKSQIKKILKICESVAVILLIPLGIMPRGSLLELLIPIIH
jgi:hypothetical protein